MSYIVQRPEVVLGLLGQHLVITLVSLAAAVAVALPLSLWAAGNRRQATLLLGLLGTIYTIPSIAMIILFIPLLGLNAWAVGAALFLYAQVILVRNFVAGIRGVDPAVLEAARGMGMNRWQRWRRVQFPLALPVMLAGVRLAAIVVIGIATIGAKFNAGGLGRLLFDGIAEGRYDKIWAGALALGALALLVNGSLIVLEQQASPEAKIRRAHLEAAPL